MRPARGIEPEHGALWVTLQRIGITQAAIARDSGVPCYVVNGAVNFRRRPTQKQQDAIEEALSRHGVAIDICEDWPEALCSDTDKISLVAAASILRTPPPLEHVYRQDVIRAVSAVINSLSAREAIVVEDVLLDGRTIRETARRMRVSGARVGQLAKSAIKKIRHPTLASILLEATCGTQSVAARPESEYR
jgi:DNA-binding CsgD family transcriptional regulator